MFPDMNQQQAQLGPEVPNGTVPASQMVPGQVGAEQVQQQPPVNPNLPAFQPGEIDPTSFNLEGLEAVLPPEAIQHLQRVHEANMQHHISRYQSQMDQRLNQATQAYQQLQDQFAAYVAQVDPSQAEYLERQRMERDYQAQLAQYEPLRQQVAKQAFVESVAQEWGVPSEALMEARTQKQVYEIAARLYAAQRRTPQVPPSQLNQSGPSGGYSQPYQIPDPQQDPDAYWDYWDQMAGRVPRSTYRQHQRRQR